MDNPVVFGLRVLVLLVVLTVLTEVFVEKRMKPMIAFVPDHQALAQSGVPLSSTEASEPKLPPCYLVTGVEHLEPIDCVSRGGSTTKPR